MNQNDQHDSLLPGPEDIDAVLAFLPIFETPGFILGEQRGGDKQADDSFTMPYVEWSEDANRFVKTLYDHRFILTSFNWSEWQHEAERFVNEPAAMESADLGTICKLLTTHVRKDRFCEGHLAGLFDRRTSISGRCRLWNGYGIPAHRKRRSAGDAAGLQRRGRADAGTAGDARLQPEDRRDALCGFAPPLGTGHGEEPIGMTDDSRSTSPKEPRKRGVSDQPSARQRVGTLPPRRSDSVGAASLKESEPVRPSLRDIGSNS